MLMEVLELLPNVADLSTVSHDDKRESVVSIMFIVSGFFIGVSVNDFYCVVFNK